jgi:hypothetical protein
MIMSAQEIQTLVSTILSLLIAFFVGLMFFKQRTVIKDMKEVQSFMSTYTNTASGHIRTLMDAFKPENLDGLIKVKMETVASEKDKEYKSIVEDLKNQIQSFDKLKESLPEEKENKFIKITTPKTNASIENIIKILNDASVKTEGLIKKYNELKEKYYLSVNANTKVLWAFEIDLNKFENLILTGEKMDEKVKKTNEEFFKDLKSNLDSKHYIKMSFPVKPSID